MYGRRADPRKLKHNNERRSSPNDVDGTKQVGLLNASANCQGKWTRIEGGKKFIIDFAITKQEDEAILTSLVADEEKECTLYLKLNEGSAIKRVYADYCSIILKLNILVREAKGPLNKYTITKKGYERYKEKLQMLNISPIVETDYFQLMYEKWSKMMEGSISQVQTKVKKQNRRIEVKKLQKIK